MKSFLIQWSARAGALFVVLALTGCGAMDLRVTASQPAPDWIYVHPNARVGDRAVWKNLHRDHHLMIWEVVGTHGDDLEVTLAWQDESGSGGSEQSGIRRHFIVGRDGTVKQAFARNYKTGDTAPMQVSSPGKLVTSRRIEDLPVAQTMTTPLGSFRVTKVLNQTFHYSVLVTTLDYSAVEFIDPTVSFGVVRSMQDIDIGGLALARLIAAVGQAQLPGASPITLYEGLKDLELSDEIRQNFSLVEMIKK